MYVDAAGLVYCTDRFKGGLYILGYTDFRLATGTRGVPSPLAGEGRNGRP